MTINLEAPIVMPPSLPTTWMTTRCPRQLTTSLVPYAIWGWGAVRPPCSLLGHPHGWLKRLHWRCWPRWALSWELVVRWQTRIMDGRWRWGHNLVLGLPFRYVIIIIVPRLGGYSTSGTCIVPIFTIFLNQFSHLFNLPWRSLRMMEMTHTPLPTRKWIWVGNLACRRI
uniref:Uncharacterized protein n=1 Tax=Opuntia streptacantha TaxID=393608 RepID=A0A7C9AF23_OPUST